MEPEIPVRTAVIYYSATGTVHTLALAAAEGAEKAGAEVRLRRVAETAPRAAIEARPEWARHRSETAGVPEAAVGDLEWADVALFGTPTRFGTMSAQLKAFIDATGPLWAAGGLADKVYSAFTASHPAHGGQESTLPALGNVFCHWGGIIVPPGSTDPVRLRSGTPCGTSDIAADGPPGDVALEAARYQAWRAVTTAAALAAGRRQPV
ncbi:NAD(P)H:quinone oxidoreductase [Streptomyces sp. MAR4 CNX-425]|uniref:NAD(P)H:quinone oxidoreductase n=1 Tax=Streptomyces sp. MAR4 CNX-425 TaxID=3406343 RepID=UPI003B50454F